MSGETYQPHRLEVVVVDDTPDLRDLLRLALERSGDFVVVAEADNGRQGVEVAGAHQPDLVILDIAMPEMDGLEALPLLREACPTSTVVMLSGFGTSEMTRRALERGADGYIQKGQPLSSLLTQVRTLVAKADARRAVGSEPEADDRPSEQPPVLDHLELAPFGFLQVRAGRIMRANREAGRLLGDLSTPDLPLESAAPVLAAHLLAMPAFDVPTFLELGDPPRQVLVTVRRSGDDHVLYLQSQSGDEADLLRRAIATAAHEIRGPVAVLMGMAETLNVHADDLSQAEQERMLGSILRQTRLLDSITADLLAAGQAQHGTLALQMEKVDTTELVRAVVDDGFDLTLVEDSRARVLTDPLRFQQMLTNLLSNARKYGAPPFLVRITSQGSQVSIDVEDNGPGVPEDFRPHLFQEYSRAPGTSARGTGLGLFVVRALAEAQGGSVTYAPRDPQGSVFTLRLPAVPS
jgi:signal transduction histidine kinase/DNA-binding NarL/FixJ family response regulator